MKHCRYCGRLTAGRCAWPRVRIVNVPFAEVRVGDVVVAHSGSKQEHRVVYIAPQPQIGEVWLATEWQGKVMERVEVQPWRGMWAPRHGSCDAPCCNRHLRRVGPGRSYCAACWGKWEKVT